MNSYSHMLDRAYENIEFHSLWLNLKYDPSQNGFTRYHAVVFDDDGVQGEHRSSNPVDAINTACHRQQQNRILFDRPPTKGMK